MGAPPAAAFSAPAPEPDAPGRRRRVGIAMLPTKVSPGERELLEKQEKRGTFLFFLIATTANAPLPPSTPFDSLRLLRPLSKTPKTKKKHKKKQAAKHLRPELIEAVGKAGYEIVPVVPGKLAEAGRLDALLHKIRTPGEFFFPLVFF